MSVAGQYCFRDTLNLLVGNNNLMLNYVRMGEGEPLVILHGLFGSSKNWQSLSRVFSQHFDVLTLDLRNHGESFHSDVMDYPAMVDDVHQLLSHLGIKSCRLIGHSMGGKVAMLFALKYPQMVSQLVVADIAPIANLHNYDHLIDPVMALKLDEMDSRAAIDKALQADIADTQLRQFLLQSLVREPSGSGNGWRWKINWCAIKQQIDKITGFPGSDDNTALDNVQTKCWKVSTPTLFISGSRSDYVDEIGKFAINQHFEQPQFKVLNGAGHWLHAEQPKQFVEASLKFFKI
ncbi:MAG: esterase [Polaribacter sp.]|jgi:esterase